LGRIKSAWIGNLTALAPYQPVFIGATLAFLATGYYLVYRKPRGACAEGEACAPTAEEERQAGPLGSHGTRGVRPGVSLRRPSAASDMIVKENR
jgi:hypothetical protein